jgi:hypothetical protein
MTVIIYIVAMMIVPGIIYKIGNMMCKTDEAKDISQSAFQVLLLIALAFLLAKGCDAGFHPYIPPDP